MPDPETAEPLRHADGRIKKSPDETSLLGLNAVWTELDGDLPHPDAVGRRGRRASAARRRSNRTVFWGLITAVVIAVGALTLAFAVLH